MTENNCEYTDSIESIGIQKLYIKAGSKYLIENGNIGLLMGHKYGILGRNGCGKTSLLIYLNSLLKGIYIDQFISNDKWTEKNIIDAILSSNSEIINILNEESNDLEKFNEIQQKISSLEIDKDKSLIKKILNGLGFNEEDFNKSYYEFSGGWRTRISLARALYMKPRILFLDEPTNHLDLEAICWLENYLEKYKGILVFVSHNISFINNVATDILHISNQKIKYYSGNYYRFCKQYDSELKKQESDWSKYQKNLKNLKSKGKQKEIIELEKKIKKDDISKPEKPYKIIMNFECNENVKSPYVQLDNVSFQYSLEKQLILKDVDFKIENNTKITIVGKNGSGKTTLLKLIKGELTPTNGKIFINENVNTSDFNQHSIENLPEELTPVEYLQEKYPKMSEKDIRCFLGKIALESIYHIKPIKVLSGGQKMRIVFSEIIITKPNLLLLDEPTNHLDIETIEALIDSLNNYQGSVIIITHDLNLIEETNCLIYHLHDQNLMLLKNGINEYLKN